MIRSIDPVAAQPPENRTIQKDFGKTWSKKGMSAVANLIAGEVKTVPKHPGFETRVLEQKNESDYRCRKCNDYCVEAVVAFPCGHFYCKSCLILKNSRCCCDVASGDDTGFTHTNTNMFKPFVNVIKDVDGICRVCSVICIRGLNGEGYDEHILECPVKCPYECSYTTSRRQFDDHVLVCPKVKVHCSAYDLGCDVSYCRKDISAHQLSCVFVRESHVRRAQKKCSEEVVICKELAEAQSAKILAAEEQIASHSNVLQKLDQRVSANYKKLKQFASTFSENSLAQHRLINAMDEFQKEALSMHKQQLEVLEKKVVSMEKKLASMEMRFISFAFPGEVDADGSLKFSPENSVQPERYRKAGSPEDFSHILSVDSSGTKVEIRKKGVFRVCVNLLAQVGTSSYPFLQINGAGGSNHYFYTSGPGFSNAQLDRSLRFDEGDILTIKFQGVPNMYPSGTHFMEIHLLKEEQ